MTVEQFEPIAAQRSSESIFPLRENEPDYAMLNDPQTQDKNRYGNLIALTDLIEEATSLNINGVSEKGFNPNRNKQHAFHFTADNCIGCHACESACSEKNDLPPHLSFRSVGYVEGGSYPDFFRMNISMACNHCDDPVCLKGCPTRAYTKHPEYGAVLQDPDICFGCGYCTWVCPYNAPQLDPVKGQVEKCNMCVDRLEVGLKPACVSACLGNALDFGVVENTPERRDQIETRIPGFPDPAISQPNIRFQQTRTLPREMTRTDSAPIKYTRDDQSGHYIPKVDRKSGQSRHWNLLRLSSRENPLVLFTLASQAAIGLYILLALGRLSLLPALTAPGLQSLGLFLCAALAGTGLLLSAGHLGKPFRFYRGFNNLRHSPMAREGLAAALFLAFTGLQWLASLPMLTAVTDMAPWLNNVATFAHTAVSSLTPLALLSGALTIYYMVRCYLIKARPFWNHWYTGASFFGNAVALGAVMAGGLTLASTGSTNGLALLAAAAAMGMSLELIGLIAHRSSMVSASHEGAASFYIQTTTFGWAYLARNSLLTASVGAMIGVYLLPPQSLLSAALLWLVLGSIIVTVALVGRALFYVLVVPTTMPGAFFWKNKGFEKHARDIGLAANPSVGVAIHGH